MSLELELAEAIIQRNALAAKLKDTNVSRLTRYIISQNIDKISRDIDKARVWLNSCK